MKFEFPDTGEGVTEGTFLDWKVGEGDSVEEDQVVGEAETDKAVVEIPAPADGTVEKLYAEPGDSVEVGEVIMELDTGEAVESGVEEDSNVEESSKQEEGSEDLDESPDKPGSSVKGSSDVLALPKVRKKARENGIDLESLGVEGRIRMADLEDVAEAETRERGSDGSEQGGAESETVSTPEDVEAAPSVRKLARENGIDISEVEGSGRGGKITRDDVKNYSKDAGSGSDSGTAGDSEEISGEELSSVEEFTAEKMVESKFSAPHVTHIEKVDVTDLVELRNQANEEVEPHLTYMPFIMKASMLAMKKYERANAHFDGEKMELDLRENYDFNIAVDTDRGLLVPRIDNVGEKNLLELAVELSDTVEAAQDGELGREDMQPGSFSITNIGAIGGEAFTPIINPPQTCILGVGKIQETAEVVDGEVVPRMTVKLSFSYDHRVIEGAYAARFVNEVKENLENPEEMMVNI